jgi:hypothetical protein
LLYVGKEIWDEDPRPFTLVVTWLEYPSSDGTRLWLLIDPVELGALVADDITLGEPESNLLLGILDTVGAVAYITTNIDGIVAADRARGRSKGVCGTEDG